MLVLAGEGQCYLLWLSVITCRLLAVLESVQRGHGRSSFLALRVSFDFAAISLNQLALPFHVVDHQRRILHVVIVQSQAFAALVFSFIWVVFGGSLLISLRVIPFRLSLIHALVRMGLRRVALLTWSRQTVDHDLRELVDLLLLFKDIGVVHEDVGSMRRKTAGSHLSRGLLQRRPVRDQLVVEGDALLELLVIDFESCKESKDLRVQADELVDEVRLLKLILIACKDCKSRELFVAGRHPAGALNEVVLYNLLVHFG